MTFLILDLWIALDDCKKNSKNCQETAAKETCEFKQCKFWGFLFVKILLIWTWDFNYNLNNTCDGMVEGIFTQLRNHNSWMHHEFDVNSIL